MGTESLVDLEEVKILVSAKLEIDAQRAKRMAELIEEARRKSGNPDMVTYQALAYLAERGHAEASDILDAMTSPGYMQDGEDTMAAAAVHPDWESKDGGIIDCTDTTCTENTPDKLLAWYRRKH